MRTTTKKSSAPKALLASANKATLTLRKRGEALLALIERRKARITEDFYDIGEALRTLSQPRIYGALGFRTFDELLAGRKVMARSQAFKLMQIVDGLGREDALRLGSEKSFAVIGYAAATTADDLPKQLVASGVIGGVPLAKLSARQILAKAERLRARRRKPEEVSPAERAATRDARAWQAALRNQGKKTAVVEVEKKRGELWLVARVRVR